MTREVLISKSPANLNADNHCINAEINDLTSYMEDEDVGIVLDVSRKGDNGRRIWNKKHSCCFCNKSISKMARHYEDAHPQEQEVIEAHLFPKQSKERSFIYEKLTRRGDYFHNIEVLHLNDGQLHLLRNPTAQEVKGRIFQDYGPCPGCLGFLIKTDLWRHGQKCEHLKKINEVGKTKQKDNSEEIKQRGQLQRDSKLLLMGNMGSIVNKEFKMSVLCAMCNDNITKVAQSDWLIVSLGCFVFEKHGPSQKKLISQYMRIMGRLLIVLREENQNDNLALEDVINPESFDNVVHAVQLLAKRSIGQRNQPEFQLPSLALKLGHHLMKCAQILKGKALKTRNKKMEDNASSFIDLYTLEWATKVNYYVFFTTGLHLK